jgi:hypothetical protein
MCAALLAIVLSLVSLVRIGRLIFVFGAAARRSDFFRQDVSRHG